MKNTIRLLRGGQSRRLLELTDMIFNNFLSEVLIVFFGVMDKIQAFFLIHCSNGHFSGFLFSLNTY